MTINPIRDWLQRQSRKASSMKGFSSVLPLLLALLPASALALDHVHVQISYGGGAWDLFVYDYETGKLPVDDVTFPVPAAARAAVPEDPRFTHALGPAGNPVWILPQIERPGLISLGVGTSGIGPNIFLNNTLRLSLERVEGPGHFAMYTSDSLGAPRWLMTSLDGIEPELDALDVPAVGAHLHMNWAFTAPGRYKVGFSVSGILRTTQQRTKSEVVDYSFKVVPLAPRLRVQREENELILEAVSEDGWHCQVERAIQVSGPWTPHGEPFVGSSSGVKLTLAFESAQLFFRLLSHPAAEPAGPVEP
jgi:surface-anchored protein